MSDTQNLSTMDLYKTIRSFSDFLKTDVKVSKGMIDKKVPKGYDYKILKNPGCTVEVAISNTAPVESDYPLIVFMDVGLRVQLPKTVKRSTRMMANDSNLEVDLTNTTQYNSFSGDVAKRIVKGGYPTKSIDDKMYGHVLFPNQSMKYKFSLTDKECPDVKEIKLWAEWTISRRHLLHHRKEIAITSECIIYQL